MLNALAKSVSIALLMAVSPVSAEPRKSMQAVRYSEFGPSTVLRIVDIPMPALGKNQVLVRLRAAGVNSLDWGNRSGLHEIPAGRLPIVPGHDFAGDVAQWGEGVTNRRLGEDVFAMLPPSTTGGSYAEFVAIDNDLIADSPKNIDPAAAATVPLAALTAYQALFDKGHLKRGQTVLIHGADGDVGHYAVQLARDAGADIVGTGSSAGLELMKKLGAKKAIDYSAEGFEDQVGRVDLMLDTVGGDTFKRLYGAVRRGGIVISLTETPGGEVLEQRGLKGERLSVSPNGEELGRISELIEKGAVVPEVVSVFTLADAAKAQDQDEAGQARGRVAIRIEDRERDE